MKIEYKQFEFKVEEASDSGIIRGYASTFGNIDLGDDVVDKGAFKKTIRESKGRIPILADHNPYMPLGWNVEAEEDEKGLLVEGHLNLEIQAARERYALAKQALSLKAPMGLSIGYSVVKAEPDKERPAVRRLKEIRLYEYSLVVFPMNQAAMVTAAKSWAENRHKHDLITEIRQKATALGIAPSDLMQALLEQEAAINAPTDPGSYAQSIERLTQILMGDNRNGTAKENRRTG